MPWGGSLPRTVFLIDIVLWSPGTQASLLQGPGIPSVDYTFLMALAVQLQSTEGRKCPLALARLWDNALATQTCQL